jgi:tetratricopeptide (TPR) repeat protein
MLKNFKKAIEIYNICLEIDSKYIKAIFEKGHCFMKLNQNEEALKEFERCLKIDEKFENALARKG